MKKTFRLSAQVQFAIALFAGIVLLACMRESGLFHDWELAVFPPLLAVALSLPLEGKGDRLRWMRWKGKNNGCCASYTSSVGYADSFSSRRSLWVFAVVVELPSLTLWGASRSTSKAFPLGGASRSAAGGGYSEVTIAIQRSDCDWERRRGENQLHRLREQMVS